MRTNNISINHDDPFRERLEIRNTASNFPRAYASVWGKIRNRLSFKGSYLSKRQVAGLIAFSIVLVTVSLEAISFYLYKTAALSDFLPSWMEKAQPFLTGLVIIILNFLAFTIPMKLGARRLEEDILN